MSPCAEILQVLPAAVDLLLEQGQEMLIAGFEEVFESSLGAQEILDGKFVFGFVAQTPFAVSTARRQISMSWLVS